MQCTARYDYRCWWCLRKKQHSEKPGFTGLTHSLWRNARLSKKWQGPDESFNMSSGEWCRRAVIGLFPVEIGFTLTFIVVSMKYGDLHCVGNPVFCPVTQYLWLGSYIYCCGTTRRDKDSKKRQYTRNSDVSHNILFIYSMKCV